MYNIVGLLKLIRTPLVYEAALVGHRDGDD